MSATQIQNMTNSLNSSKAVLEKSEFSVAGADTSQVPFFINDSDKEVSLSDLEKESTPEYRSLVSNLASKWKFTPHLKHLYLLLCTSNREFTYRGFTFFSLDKIISRLDEYEANDQHCICDIALRYEGMGWVEVLALDTESGKYFVRLDGGSNGYDRQFNWDYYKTYRPSSRPETLIDESLIFDTSCSEDIVVEAAKMVNRPC